MTKHVKHVAIGEGDGRLCRNPECRAPLVRKVKETGHHFVTRESCGPTCGNHARSYAAAGGYTAEGAGSGKLCKVCGAPLIRDVGEPLSGYNRRRACRGALTSGSCGATLHGLVRRNLAEIYRPPGWEATGKWPELPPWAFSNNISPEPFRPMRMPRPDAARYSGSGNSIAIAVDSWGAGV